VLQVTLTDCVPSVLRTLAASVAQNAALHADPDQSGGADTARVGDFTEAASIICSQSSNGAGLELERRPLLLPQAADMPEDDTAYDAWHAGKRRC